MAEILHSAVIAADTHDAKPIETATAADEGKVITPSTAQNGVGILDRITSTKVTGKRDVFSLLVEMGVSQTYYIPLCYSGRLIQMYFTNSVITNGTTVDTITTTLRSQLLSSTTLATSAAIGTPRGFDYTSTQADLISFTSTDVLEIACDGADPISAGDYYGLTITYETYADSEVT